MRLVYYLIAADSGYNSRLATLISQLQKRIVRCQECNGFSEDVRCAICGDQQRNHHLLCVVAQPQDVEQLENAHEYEGLYHVLRGHISPIDGLGPNEIGIPELLTRIEKRQFQEVIIATNPTAEGDTTALYIAKLLAQRNIAVSRPAMGLPVGGDLEYADRLTIARSLRNRTSLSF